MSADPELWLAQRLGAFVEIFGGATTFEDRRERTRAVILERGVAGDTAVRAHGETITWGAAFARVYGEELQLEETR